MRSPRRPSDPSRVDARCALRLVGYGVFSFVVAMPGVSEAGPAQTAITHCHRVELAAKADRPAAIEHALALAETALSAAPDEAGSHYAVFCALAKRVRHSGTSIRVLSDLRRMGDRIDRALKIDPDYAEAHAAKGAYLYYLPRLLGGNTRTGVELLERSIALDPHNPATRLLFADVLADMGDHVASLRESHEAAKLLAADRDERHKAAACAVVDICADGRWSKEARLVVSRAC